MKRLLLVFCLLTLMFWYLFRFFGERETVKTVIRKYILLLSEGYENLNLTPLREVATEKECDRAYFHMAAWGETRRKIISTMTKLEFLRFEKAKDTEFRVETLELWDFRHIDLDSRQVVKEFKNEPHHLVYTLEKEAEKWIVSKVDFLEERKETEKP